MNIRCKKLHPDAQLPLFFGWCVPHSDGIPRVLELA